MQHAWRAIWELARNAGNDPRGDAAFNPPRYPYASQAELSVAERTIVAVSPSPPLADSLRAEQTFHVPVQEPGSRLRKARSHGASHMGPRDALMNVAEVAVYLRTTRKGVYCMIARGALPVTRVGRRVLVRRAVLEHALDEKTATSPSRR